MLTAYSPQHRLHHGTELKDGIIKPSFEEPQRAELVLAAVQRAHLGPIIEPRPFDRACYVAAHTERYVTFLENAWHDWTATGRQHDALPLVWPVGSMAGSPEPDFIDGQLGYFAMDAGAPITAGTWPAARASADTALTAVSALLQGAPAAFALCRPPGHHAGRQTMGGYCYLNNAAIAAEYALAHGGGRIAILDVDFHHGNGTQDIYYHRPDVLYASLHGDPRHCYPYFAGHAHETGSGAGSGYTANYPLPKGTDWQGYQPALTAALQRIRAHQPRLLIVSLGVDTYRHDPISHFRLDSPDYLRMGQLIASTRLPTLFVLEGGYRVDDIGLNVTNTLQGFEQSEPAPPPSQG